MQNWAGPLLRQHSPVKPQAGPGNAVNDTHELSACDAFAHQCE